MKKQSLFAKIFSILLILVLVFSSAAVAFAGGGESEEEKRQREEAERRAKEAEQAAFEGRMKAVVDAKTAMDKVVDGLLKNKKEYLAEQERIAKEEAAKKAEEIKKAKDAQREAILKQQKEQLEKNEKKENAEDTQNTSNEQNSSPSTEVIMDEDEGEEQGEQTLNEGDITYENESGETVVITADEFNSMTEEQQSEVRHEAAKDKINNEGYSQDKDTSYDANKSATKASGTDENVVVSKYYSQEYNGAGNNVYSIIVDPLISLINSFLFPLIDIVTAVGGVYCILLGVKLARAEDPQEREKAKTNIKNFLVGYVLIFILVVTLNLIKDPMINWIATTVGNY